MHDANDAARAVAVRPNLNRRDTLTVHRLLADGRPDYHYRLQRIGGADVYLRRARPHVDRPAAAAIRAGRRCKEPCAAIIGELGPPPAPSPAADWRLLRFNPRRHDDFVIADSGALWIPGAGDLVCLRGNRAWLLREYQS